MTRLKGRILKRPTDLKPWLLTLAGLASQIHELPIADRSLPTYGLWGLEDSLVVPAWWRDAGVWSAAVEVFRGPRPHEPPSFIHRDFHPANILWIGRRLTGVVDWLHGCWGPPSADLAHCRINLWLDNSPAAAEALLDAYRQVRPQSPAYNPYWDIADAMSWRLDPNRHGPRRARRWEAFITAAVRAILGGRGVAGELNRAAETMST
jgi:Ser/Thr protein kinase RdoA (MazF antagonist)